MEELMMSEEAKALGAKKLKKIKDYIYSCADGDTKYAQKAYETCLRQHDACDFVLDEIKKGKKNDIGTLYYCILHWDD